jgi:hypothetical protein
LEPIIFSKAFALGLAERAIKTFAQVLLGFVAVTGVGLTQIDWADAMDVAAAATVASVLTSVVTPRQATLNTEATGKHTA